VFVSVARGVIVSVARAVARVVARAMTMAVTGGGGGGDIGGGSGGGEGSGVGGGSAQYIIVPVKIILIYKFLIHEIDLKGMHPRRCTASLCPTFDL
jgi:hypothetical protein